jgi:hypothetical protein
MVKRYECDIMLVNFTTLIMILDYYFIFSNLNELLPTTFGWKHAKIY